MAALLLQCTTGFVTIANKSAKSAMMADPAIYQIYDLSRLFVNFRPVFNSGAILQRSGNICASAACCHAKGADGCPSAPFSTQRRA